MEGRCATFSIKGILDDIQSIDFGILGLWSNEIIDSLVSDLYERDLKTIDEFYGTFDYFINSDDDVLRRRVLIDKFNYIKVKMTDKLCSINLNDRYIDEEPDLQFSRLDSILVFDFGDSDSDIDIDIE